MNKHRKILTICFTTVAVVCLAAAVYLFVSARLSDKHTEAVVDSLKQSAEPGASANSDKDSAENSGTASDEGSGENSDAASDEGSGAAGDTENEKENTKDTVAEEPDGNASAADSEKEAVPNPYRDSFLANDDMAAWLEIPGTVIDYPVLWTPRDENYYLRRGFDGKSDQNGCLILDTDSSLDPLTTNLIIHGHNMRSGTMFGTLSDYAEEDFYKEHKQMTLYTKECQRNYEVLAVFRSEVFKKTDTVFKFYKFFQADTREEFDDFYQNIKAMSLYDTGVTAEFGDHFLTLSTCSYHTERGRFVVVAVETAPGDTYLPLEP